MLSDYGLLPNPTYATCNHARNNEKGGLGHLFCIQGSNFVPSTSWHTASQARAACDR